MTREQETEIIEKIRQEGARCARNASDILESCNEQTEEICMAAIAINPCALEYVTNQTEEICMAAVTEDGFALEYVINQTEEICLAAVRQNGFALKYVREQTEEMCLTAVTGSAYTLQYVKNQTLKIVSEALKQDWRIAIESISKDIRPQVIAALEKAA